MKRYTIEEIKAGSKFVPIEEIRMNDWNPKTKRSEEYYKVKQSIEVNGQVMPVVVRNAKSKDFKYEILDGEQRYTAMVDLGFDEVWIVNLGDVPDNEAKSTTIWMEQAVPFDDNLLGELLVELKGSVELPYTEEEIDLIAGVFPEKEDNEEEDEGLQAEYTRFSFTVSRDDIDDVKDMHRSILDKHLNVPEGIDAGVVNWALIKLATMAETQDLLKQVINTKIKLNNMEEDDESHD